MRRFENTLRAPFGSKPCGCGVRALALLSEPVDGQTLLDIIASALGNPKKDNQTSVAVCPGRGPPYFNLPSVGWDTYGRTGRGYPAGRLRGEDWVYGDVEYRFDLMRNRLLGAVAFVNGSTLSDASGNYGRWAYGGGAGVRVRLDKKYGTNLAIDFAWGRDGSRGVWFWLNEAL